MTLTVCLCFLFVIFANAQPPSPGLHDEIPIDVDCMAFQQRQVRILPIVLESRNPGPLTQRHLARHHIIPASTFLQFFTAAVTLPVDSNNVVLSGIMNLMGFLANATLNLYPDDGANVNINRFIRRRLEALHDLQRLYVIEDQNPPLEVLFSDVMLVQSMFQWIPANIFIGPNPQIRSDDPGNAFEENSTYIIGEQDFQRLSTLNRLMNSFILQPTITHTETNDQGEFINVTYNNYAEFNEAIEILSELSQTRHEPYPFDSDQWDYNVYTQKYSIRRQSYRQRRWIAILTDYDPFCLRPLMVVAENIKNYNLIIVAKALDRVRKGSGFVIQDSYESWKDYYADVTWGTIYEVGLTMLGWRGERKVFGYVFRDKSFAVGISGADAIGESDNWVNLSSRDFREVKDPELYAGQIYFDKNGRPVAIVLTSYNWESWGAGYSFLYVNGKWEYESTDTWDTRRFSAQNTFALDWHAPRFVTD